MTEGTSPKVSYLDIFRHAFALDVKVYDIKDCKINRDEDLGSGAQMTVYKGICKVDYQERDVAFKVPHVKISDKTRERITDGILENIRQEVRLMVHLHRHPNIIEFYGITFEDLNPILIVELAIKTLRDYLEDAKKASSRIDWETKARFCFEIASALQAIHEGSIVFGDLKGENVLVVLNSDGSVTAKISDFGFSASLFSVGKGHIPGYTHKYRAPELFDKNLASWNCHPMMGDIYSYGLLVWHIANDGKDPFENLTHAEIDALKISDPELHILKNSIPKDTPTEFWHVISGATAYVPSERKSLSELKSQIVRLFDAALYDAKKDFEKFAKVEAFAKEPLRDASYPKFRYVKDLSVPQKLKQRLFNDYEKSAKNGNPELQFYLAKCYATGFGVTKDLHKAIALYDDSAKGGMVEAQYELGSCYLMGIGVERNYETAANWFKKAADAGNASAQDELGGFYEKGFGVEKDLTTALEWYQKAAERNSIFIHVLRKFYERHPYEAVKWYTKTGNPEDPVAMYYLAICHECGCGDGIEKDLEKAITLYRKVAIWAESEQGERDFLPFPYVTLMRHLENLSSYFGIRFNVSNLDSTPPPVFDTVRNAIIRNTKPSRESKSFFEDTQEPSGKANSCIIREGEELYKCSTCSVNDNRSLCMQCFHATNHIGHDTWITVSSHGVFCDCNDVNSWKSDLQCRFHPGATWGKEYSQKVDLSPIGLYYKAVRNECGAGIEKNLVKAEELYDILIEWATSESGMANRDMLPYRDLKRHLGSLQYFIEGEDVGEVQFIDGQEVTWKPCQRLSNEIYICNTCSLYSNQRALCLFCFHATSHTDHDVWLIYNRVDGYYCDCGNTKSWKTNLSCKLHFDFPTASRRSSSVRSDHPLDARPPPVSAPSSSASSQSVNSIKNNIKS